MGVSGLELQFEFTNGYEMLHKAWNSKGEMPYRFPRSSVKFQGHAVQNITDFDPNWAFPDYRPVAAFKSLRFALLSLCLWVHYKKCLGLKTLAEDMSYEFPRCRGEPGVRPIDGCPFKEVEVGDSVLEAVDRFCYLGDMLSAGGGCMAAATARCRCAWGKFRENLPLLMSKPVPFDRRGRLFSSNVRSSMLHGTETWPMTSNALHRLCRNDRAMIRWICGVKPSDDPSMDDLHAKLGICDLAILVRERRLRWFGHVMRSNGEINRVRSRPVPGRKGTGRPKKTWDECVKQDLKVCGLSEVGTQDRVSWRSSVKNSWQEPTPSNGSATEGILNPTCKTKQKKKDCRSIFSCDQAALQMVFSVCPSVRLSVTPFWLCSHHRIIMKFSGVITNDQSKVHAKGQGQRSKVKVTEVTTRLNRFRTVTPVWIHIWLLPMTNVRSMQKVKVRGALLFFKVIWQISRSHGSENRRIWPRLGVSGL